MMAIFTVLTFYIKTLKLTNLYYVLLLTKGDSLVFQHASHTAHNNVTSEMAAFHTCHLKSHATMAAFGV